MDPVVVRLTDRRQSPLLRPLPEVEKQLFVLDVLPCQLLSEFGVLVKQELLIRNLSELILESVLDSSELGDGLSKTELGLLVPLLMLGGCFGVVLCPLPLILLNLLLTHHVEVLELKPQEPLLCALEYFVDLPVVREVTL